VYGRAFLTAMDEVIADFGEQMVHQFQNILTGKAADSVSEKPIIYLPCGLYKDKQDLIEDLIRRNLLPPCNPTYVRRLWKQFYSHVHIKKWIPFAKCELCCVLRDTLTSTRDKDIKEACRQRQQWHRLRLGLARLRHTARMRLGEVLPQLFLSLITDGMDNRKSVIPRLAQARKDVDNTGEELPTKLQGTLVHGHGFFATWCYPKYSGGASMICTVLLDVVNKIKAKTPLPPVLLIQADNCGRENKNRVVVGFIAYLVQRHVFECVELHFLLVGHTHSIIDALFATVYRAVKYKNVYTIDNMIEELDGVLEGQGGNVHDELHEIANFNDYFSPSNMNDVHGLGTVRDKLTNSKRCLHSVRVWWHGGRVCLAYKIYDQSGKWHGHWATDEPLPLFKTEAVFDSDISACPRLRTKNLDKIQARVNAIFRSDILNVPNQRPEVKVKLEAATKWWHDFFEEEKVTFARANEVPQGQAAGASADLNPDDSVRTSRGAGRGGRRGGRSASRGARAGASADPILDDPTRTSRGGEEGGVGGRQQLQVTFHRQKTTLTTREYQFPHVSNGLSHAATTPLMCKKPWTFWTTWPTPQLRFRTISRCLLLISKR